MKKESSKIETFVGVWNKVEMHDIENLLKQWKGGVGKGMGWDSGSIFGKFLVSRSEVALGSHLFSFSFSKSRDFYSKIFILGLNFFRGIGNPTISFARNFHQSRKDTIMPIPVKGQLDCPEIRVPYQSQNFPYFSRWVVSPKQLNC